MVTFNTPKVVPKLRPGEGDIVFFIRGGQHLSEMANTPRKVYQCESEALPVLHHADKCWQLGEIHCQMDEAVPTCFQWFFKRRFLHYVFITFHFSYPCSDLKMLKRNIRLVLSEKLRGENISSVAVANIPGLSRKMQTESVWEKLIRHVALPW